MSRQTVFLELSLAKRPREVTSLVAARLDVDHACA
jgi:hypothetical protein